MALLERTAKRGAQPTKSGGPGVNGRTHARRLAGRQARTLVAADRLADDQIDGQTGKRTHRRMNRRRNEPEDRRRRTLRRQEAATCKWNN